MRLYYGTTKKVAKKHLGKCWKRAVDSAGLKVGDQLWVDGKPETITELLPVYWCRKRHKIICQLGVFTEQDHYVVHYFA